MKTVQMNRFFWSLLVVHNGATHDSFIVKPKLLILEHFFLKNQKGKHKDFKIGIQGNNPHIFL